MIISLNNQPVLIISTGVVQDPKELKFPTMEEVISITTVYNTGENKTPWRFSRTVSDGSTPVLEVEIVLSVPVHPPLPHPLYSEITALKIYGKILPQTSGRPINLMVPFTKYLPMILLLRLSVVIYSVMNYPIFPLGISTCN